MKTNRELSRRKVLAGASALGWVAAFRIGPADAQASAVPPSLPAGLTFYLQAYTNWSKEISIDSLWTCAPKSPLEIVALANWAKTTGYTLRPKGHSHNWSPLTVAQGTTAANTRVILVDTTQHLTAICINTASTPKTVTVQTGASMEALLTALEGSGLGMTATPAPGDLTVGGVLAIDGHGTGIPAKGEARVPGHTFGTLSNLITSLTAVCWNASTSRYELKTFARSHPEAKAFLAHVGRAFVTEVTLQTGANSLLRCQSRVDIPAATLFAPAGTAGETFAKFCDTAGRVEAIWFPFTPNPWLKVWSKTAPNPFFSRQVTAPYNYSFSDQLDGSLADGLAALIKANPSLTPDFGLLQYNLVSLGLLTTFTWDIWGHSKNLLLYVKPTTLRVTANGYAVMCKRADVQRVIHEFYVFYKAQVETYRARGQFPMNGPVEIRVTGIDAAADVAVPSSGAGQLSAVRPRRDHPEWDCAVWLDILTFPGTAHANTFYKEVEAWVFANYASYAGPRVEWSKGWGYTDTAAWADPTALSTTVPQSLRVGQVVGDNFDTARATLNRYDPYRLFTSPLVKKLLP